MAATALLQIIKVNDKKSGTKDGRAWELQDAECILCADDGTPQTVGVLTLPKSMRGDGAPKPGFYHGQFTLAAGLRDRRIEAQLVALTPVPARKS